MAFSKITRIYTVLDEKIAVEIYDSVGEVGEKNIRTQLSGGQIDAVIPFLNFRRLCGMKYD